MAKSRMLRHNDLSDRFGIDWSRPHIAELEKRGLFPERRRFEGKRTYYYVESEIEEWLEERLRRKEAAMSGAQRGAADA